MRLSFLPALLLPAPMVELQRLAAAAAAPAAAAVDEMLWGTDAEGHSLPAKKGRLAAVAAAMPAGVSRLMASCAAAVAALLAAMRSLIKAALASAISTLCLQAGHRLAVGRLLYVAGSGGGFVTGHTHKANCIISAGDFC
jgi:hypothetical protein